MFFVGLNIFFFRTILFPGLVVFVDNFLVVQFFCSPNAPDDDAGIALPAAPLSLYSGLAYRRDPEARRAAELEETAAPAAPSAAAASGAPIGAGRPKLLPPRPPCKVLLHAVAASPAARHPTKTLDFLL